MDFLLHNTATGERERIFASDGESVRFYCCGPTVYGPAHIGNFRTFLVQDLFRRVCEGAGMAVRHVRNVTDVDDKTIRESAARGETLGDFTARWRERFEEDCRRLNLLTPHHSPSAVDHIGEQIDLIRRLEANGHAYQAADGSVYFRVDSFEAYGRLARIDRCSQRENAGGRRNADDEYSKDDVADFVLWKARKPEDGDNHWDSPWGPGRPGWHIECSAMSMGYLGESFDVHAGGVDLTFPHHENEIAQSECATGKPFVRHWFHSAHLLVEGRKMSKSLGNLFTLDDLVEQGYHPTEVRWALLSGHYRKTLNFGFDSLRAARIALERLHRMLEPADGPEGEAEDTDGAHADAVERAAPEFLPVWEGLLNDLNVPRATGALMKEVGRVEKAGAPEDPARWSASLRGILAVLGIDWRAWAADRGSSEEEEIAAPEAVRKLAAERWEAKAARDFPTADRLRGEIEAAGWQVRDAPDGFELTPKG